MNDEFIVKIPEHTPEDTPAALLEESATAETPRASAAPQESETKRAVTVVGAVTLVLMFVASAGFTASYLYAASSTAPVAQLPSSPEAAAAAVPSPNPFDALDLQAEGIYVLDTTSNTVLFQRNANAQLPLASITKVAMALSVSEVLSPNDIITIPYDTAPPGSVERLAKGEVWKESDVMTFTLVASSNAGADILAAAADNGLHQKYPRSPASGATLWRMNDLARQLHLTNTFFLNDNGLDISTTQAGAYGSAHDIATLMAYAASTSLPIFEGTSRDGFLFTSINGSTTHAYNTDEALSSIPGLVMGKTGYTDLAGGNLAVVFDVAGHRVVAVVLHSTFDGRFDDMKKLVATTEQVLGSNAAR